MELNIQKEVGKNKIYSRVSVLDGYCFYDSDLSENERIYMTYIATPILDDIELKRKFVVVKGNAKELNEELQQKQFEEMQKENEEIV